MVLCLDTGPFDWCRLEYNKLFTELSQTDIWILVWLLIAEKTNNFPQNKIEDYFSQFSSEMK